MSDEPVKVCEKCGEPVRRLLFPVAIQFKGNGFYTTDYAKRSGLGSVGSQANGGGDSESCKATTSASAEPTSKSDSTAKSDSTSKSD
jgi:predicted nucleic acid-binding Zn ribbon protein